MAPRSPKKRKTTVKKRHHREDTPYLGVDALALVMDFLAPRDLYRLAFTCKGLMSRVSTAQVVRSALFHGGRPRATIEDLVPLMENEQIHPASPLRLLRLVNAKRCECCNITAVAEASIGRYGVAFCRRRCLDPCEAVFGELPLYPVGDESNHDNEACDLPYWTRLQCLHRIDPGSFIGWDEAGGFQRNDGTQCGPIFAVHEVTEALWGPARWRRDRWNQREQELAMKTREERAKELLEDRLPPPSPSYQDFVKTYRQFHKKAEERVAQREEARKRQRDEREKRRRKCFRRELEI